MIGQLEISERGTFSFQVQGENLLNSAVNVKKLRMLWLDRLRINGEVLGPGDAGDFDQGAWHIACHLVGAAGVRKTPKGNILWFEVSHDSTRDRYFASVTHIIDGNAHTVSLDSAEGREVCADSILVGYIEGNSTGRTSARNAIDSPTTFNLWRRQDFDQPVGSEVDGGKVWEHWCTLRDIGETSELATSVLTAYVSLTTSLGDGFAAMVARGRSDYGHPMQLCAMIDAGFISEKAGMTDITPVAIPDAIASYFVTADPGRCVRACEMLDWTGTPRYFMYKRRIDCWLSAGDAKLKLEEFLRGRV